MSDPDPRRERLRGRLLGLGFDEVRFASTSAPSAGGLKAWLADGFHGEMAWMERTAERRADPGLVLPGARSMILLGVTTWDGDLGRRRTGPAWA